MAPNYSEVTIVCTPGKEVLYEDFADKLLTYTPQRYIPVGAFNRGVTEGYPLPQEKERVYLGPNTRLTDYRKRPDGIYEYRPVKPRYIKQEFIKLGLAQIPLKYDYIIHARAVDRTGADHPFDSKEAAKLKAQSKRNWDVEKWEEVVRRLPGTKASIGTQGGALHVCGTDDLRDLNLRELCSILSSSGMIFGPSSGPLHLGSLCGLSHLIWAGPPYDKKSNSIRYEKDWNPHNTPTFYLDKATWNPSPAEVLDAIEAFSHR